jgi:putative heme iron utilization protein
MNEQNPFPPEVVAQIMHHMNVDHAGDSLLICRALGGHPAASDARMTGMDADGIDFEATVEGSSTPVRLPWSQTLKARPQVREEVVRMYREACAVLGITPREAG